MRKAIGPGLVLAAALAAATPAAANEASCFTTDDGNYPCTFTSTGSDGSFEISAEGKPTFDLDMVGPGVATGTMDAGEGSVSLPGQYIRDGEDPACWDNSDTGTRICAW